MSLPTPLATLLASAQFNSRIPTSQIPLLLQISSKQTFLHREEPIQDAESAGFETQLVRRDWHDLLQELQLNAAEKKKVAKKADSSKKETTKKKVSGAKAPLVAKKGGVPSATAEPMKRTTGGMSTTKATKATTTATSEESTSDPTISVELFTKLYNILPNMPSISELKRDLLLLQREVAAQTTKQSEALDLGAMVTEVEALREAEEQAEEYGVTPHDLKTLKELGLLDLNRGKNLKEVLEEEEMLSKGISVDSLSRESFRELLQMTQDDETQLSTEEIEELLGMLTAEDGSIQPDLFVNKIAESIEQTFSTLEEIQEEEKEAQEEEAKAKATADRLKRSSTIQHQSGRAKSVAKK